MRQEQEEVEGKETVWSEKWDTNVPVCRLLGVITECASSRCAYARPVKSLDKPPHAVLSSKLLTVQKNTEGIKNMIHVVMQQRNY